jgi:hypothetical protein
MSRRHVRPPRRVGSFPHRHRIDRPMGLPKPTGHDTPVHWKCVPQHRSVRCDPGPIGPTAGDQHPSRHSHRIPSAVPRDLPCKSAALIHRPDQLVDVDNVSLQLDDEKRSTSRMPSEDVDDAPLTEDRERDLGCKDPLRQGGREPRRDCLVESRVTAGDQAIEITGSPPGRPSDLDLEHPRDREEGADRHALEMPALDRRDHRSVDRCSGRHVDLPPASLDANGPKRAAEALHRVHQPESGDGRSPLTYRVIADWLSAAGGQCGRGVAQGGMASVGMPGSPVGR